MSISKSSRGRGRPSKADALDLREPIIAAAFEAVRRSGAENLSLRRLSEELGISPSAYLHHFHGPEEVLAEVAFRGFVELLAVMRAATATGDEREAVRSLGRAYVGHAVRNGRLYRAMFSRAFADDLARADRAEAGVAAAIEVSDPREAARLVRRAAIFRRMSQVKNEAWYAIVGPFQRLSAELGLPPQRPRDAGLAYAALLHGLVGELIDEGLFPPPDGNLYGMSEERDALVERSISIFLDGALHRPKQG